jgi:hypothetical protein
MDSIPIWNAIAEMRKLTAENKPFSFKHATWDRERQNSEGIRTVNRALLRPAAKSDGVINADHKLFYIDLDVPLLKGKRNCWQVLIVEFNGIKTIAT